MLHPGISEVTIEDDGTVSLDIAPGYDVDEAVAYARNRLPLGTEIEIVTSLERNLAALFELKRRVDAGETPDLLERIYDKEGNLQKTYLYKGITEVTYNPGHLEGEGVEVVQVNLDVIRR
jgi:hypothetical protein